MKSNKEYLELADKLYAFFTGEYNECLEYEKMVYADRGLSDQQQFEKIKQSYFRAFMNYSKQTISFKVRDDKENQSDLANIVRQVRDLQSMVLSVKISRAEGIINGKLKQKEDLDAYEKRVKRSENEFLDAMKRMCEVREVMKHFSSYDLEFFTYEELVTYEECLFALRADIATAVLIENVELNKRGFFNKPNLRLIKEKWEIPQNKVGAVWLKLNCPYKTRIFANIKINEADDFTVFEYILMRYTKAVAEYVQWHTDFYKGVLEKKISIHELKNDGSPYVMQRILIFEQYKKAEELFDQFRTDRINGEFEFDVE